MKEVKIMGMTKNAIKANLELAVNLQKQIEKITTRIVKELDDSQFVAEVILDNKDADADIIYNMLERTACLRNLEDGPEVVAPNIDIDSCLDVTVSKRVPGGTMMSALDGTYANSTEAGIMFMPENVDFPMDIAWAMQRRGELAKANNLAEDNKDIEVQMYEDVYDEDYTKKYTLAMSDFEDSAYLTQVGY